MASSLRGNARSRLPRLGGILKNWSGQMQPNNNRRLVTRRSTKRTKMMEEEEEEEEFDRHSRDRQRGRERWERVLEISGNSSRDPSSRGQRPKDLVSGKRGYLEAGMEVAGLREPLFQALVEFQESMTGKFRSLLTRFSEILILETMNGYEGSERLRSRNV